MKKLLPYCLKSLLMISSLTMHAYGAANDCNMLEFKQNGATQSSTLSNANANLATDGVINGHFFRGSVTHTAPDELNNWWQGELKSKANVKEITLYNRTDCCSDRLKEFTIYGSEFDLRNDIADINDYASWSKTFNTPFDGNDSFTFQTDSSDNIKYIFIKKDANGPLSLAEVQACGTAQQFQPQFVAAIQNTDVSEDNPDETRGKAVAAIDGIKDGNFFNGSVTHTAHNGQYEKHLWIGALDQLYNLEQVKIYNRTDCCLDRLTNFDLILLTDVSISNTTEDISTILSNMIENTSEVDQFTEALDDIGISYNTYEINGASQDVYTINTDDAPAQYVAVWKEGSGPLSLAEVEVYTEADVTGNDNKNKPPTLPNGATDFFSIGFLPDTQALVTYKEAADKFKELTQFFVDKQNEFNLLFVSGVGDIVDNGGAGNKKEPEIEWKRARAAYEVLMDNGIPIIPVHGNHDSVSYNWNNNTYFNKYFPKNDPFIEGYLSGTLYGEDGLENAFYEFSALGVDITLLTLEYRKNPWIRDEVLNWANDILRNAEERGRHTIMVTHEQIYNMPLQKDGVGTLISPYNNIAFAINGHHANAPRHGITANNQNQNYFQFDFTTVGPNDANFKSAVARIYTFYPKQDQICMRTFDLSGSGAKELKGTPHEKCAIQNMNGTIKKIDYNQTTCNHYCWQYNM